MNSFRMHNTELEITTIGLGSTTIGGSVDRKTSYDLMDRYVDYGGNLIDTAHIYGASNSAEKSQSEETIGNWLKDRGCRDRIVLCTKGGHPDVDPEKGFLGKPRLHEDDLENDLTMSLQSLRTDYVDLYLMHRDDPTLPVSGIIDWLEAQREVGRIRYYGCSNWTLKRLEEAQAYAASKGYRGFVCNQIAGGLAKQNEQVTQHMDMLGIDPAFIAYHRETRMTVMSYMSMNNGYFQKRISGQTLTGFSEFIYGNPTNEALLEKLREMNEQGIRPNSVMYHYIMNYGIPVTALMGFSRVSQMDEVLRDIELPIPKEDLDELYQIRWNR